MRKINLSKRPNVKKGITLEQYCKAAKTLGCSIYAIRAVDEVESAGSGFFKNKDRVKILFEGHYFYRLLGLYNPAIRNKIAAENRDICYKGFTKKHYIGGNAEYGRIARALEACKKYGAPEEIALMSASWGRYQVMGEFIHKNHGHIVDTVNKMFETEDEHLKVFISYIKANGLSDELRRLDWNGFARGYNGPAYKRNNYHIKMANSYARFKKRPIDCDLLLKQELNKPADIVMPITDIVDDEGSNLDGTSFDNRLLPEDIVQAKTEGVNVSTLDTNSDAEVVIDTDVDEKPNEGFISTLSKYDIGGKIETVQNSVSNIQNSVGGIQNTISGTKDTIGGISDAYTSIVKGGGPNEPGTYVQTNKTSVSSWLVYGYNQFIGSLLMFYSLLTDNPVVSIVAIIVIVAAVVYIVMSKQRNSKENIEQNKIISDPNKINITPLLKR